jgi:hypothetical protein
MDVIKEKKNNKRTYKKLNADGALFRLVVLVCQSFVGTCNTPGKINMVLARW